DYLSFSSPNVVFILKCSEELISKILKYERAIEYKVVAQISSVRKTIFSIEASPINNEEAELSLDISDTFIARGQCIDLLPTGMEGFSVLLEGMYDQKDKEKIKE
ncbi:hypothetical protein LCGC14_2592770, partial [marine sediment metagenome]